MVERVPSNFVIISAEIGVPREITSVLMNSTERGMDSRGTGGKGRDGVLEGERDGLCVCKMLT